MRAKGVPVRLADEPPGPQRLSRVPDGPDLDSEGATGPGAGAGGGEEVYEIHSRYYQIEALIYWLVLNLAFGWAGTSSDESFENTKNRAISVGAGV